ncbi:MAG: DinB family protein [Calditrichaeota bacterium]|nr:DinB family protein [Calditrichota bacterium]
MTESLVKLFDRDLDRLINELNAYKNEDTIWEISGDIKNSAGNLSLHLIGNLKHFIGAILGKSGYQRQRELEFSKKDVSRQGMIDEINETREIIKSVLAGLSEHTLKANYPIEVMGFPMTTEFFLIHLNGHLNYHLGQINYHRRLIS